MEASQQLRLPQSSLLGVISLGVKVQSHPRPRSTCYQLNTVHVITYAVYRTLSSHIKSSSKTRSSLSDAKTKSSRKTKRTIPALPLLTSTFRAKDLIRPVASPFEDGSGEWEFLPAKVPDGISLRNFGIQVVSFALAFLSLCIGSGEHNSLKTNVYSCHLTLLS